MNHFRSLIRSKFVAETQVCIVRTKYNYKIMLRKKEDFYYLQPCQSPIFHFNKTDISELVYSNLLLLTTIIFDATINILQRFINNSLVIHTPDHPIEDPNKGGL